MKLQLPPILLLASYSLFWTATSVYGAGGIGDPCQEDLNCNPIQCFVPPCPAAICVNGACQIEPNPPNPECVQDKDCPPIACVTEPCDVNVCNFGLCEIVPASTPELTSPGEVPLPQQTCRGDEDCPQIQCFAAPCDINICNDSGVCELVPPPQSEQGTRCGPNVCQGMESECCNESCGICTEPGGFCTQQYCGEVDQTVQGTRCGPSICQGTESECCNESCGICTEPGGFCTQQYCGEVEPPIEEEKGEVCGSNVCLGGQTCCNDSCSICTYPDEACIQMICDDPEPKGVACGHNTCQEGQFCCNESCGICADEGGFCTEQFCMSPPPKDEDLVEDTPQFTGGAACNTTADCQDGSSITSIARASGDVLYVCNTTIGECVLAGNTTAAEFGDDDLGIDMETTNSSIDETEQQHDRATGTSGSVQLCSFGSIFVLVSCIVYL